MNKYANLVGTNKIKDEYTKINTGFDGVETDIDALNYLVDALDSRVDTIITTPIDGETAAQELVDARAGFSTIGGRMTQIEGDIETHAQELVDARASAVKSKTFATLDARFEETEQDVESHMADNVTDSDGAHGLKIESGTFTPTIAGLTTAGANTYSVQTGNYLKMGKLVFIAIYISLSAKDSAMEGNTIINGLPFVPNRNGGINIGEYRYITRASDRALTCRFTNNLSRLDIRYGGVNTYDALPATAINNNTTLILSGVYETN